LQTIGATTSDEYRKHIEKDKALERRFQPVYVGEPTVEQATRFLRVCVRGTSPPQSEITDVAEAAVSPRKAFADKGHDLIDEPPVNCALTEKALLLK
jgi:ATP-dependent Clp protease ATP-binding subunit ClpC